VSSILRFFEMTNAFDDTTLNAIRDSYDAACKDMDDGDLPQLVREIIARRIIDAAKAGERDPVRLCEAGLAALA
jgi:hypothetical protein